MRKIILTLGFVLAPSLAYGAVGTVNNQSTYAVPPGSSNVLILDITLQELPSSITVYNDGTAQQTDISKISVFEDGNSAGWDGDEKDVAVKTYSPFFGTKLSGNFSKKRVFVTVDIASNAVSERTIQPKIKTNISEEEVLGLERKILAGASSPQTPSSPLAQSGEALSDTTIRWKFLDLASNEFGFKILDSQLKITVKSETADLSYLDETGLSPNTCYSGRRAAAYNDRGESDYSVNFSQVCTLAAPVVEEVPPTETPGEVLLPETPGVDGETPGVEEPEEDLSIAIRQQIIDILQQLIQLLQEKISSLQANLFQAFEAFVSWF
ncbi:MAG: hypothetical protein HYW69_00060 [Candidatus Nealsonbacteria bacterium]|nr:hypothetical protein [Candidatus Nealsonbacteria bacterium]